MCFYADIYNLSIWYGSGSRNKSKTAVGIARDIAEIHGVISFLFTIPPIQRIEILPLCQHSIRQLQVIRGSLNIHLLRSRFHQLRLYNQNPQQNRRRSPCRRRREVFSSLVRFLVVVCSKMFKENQKKLVSGFMTFTLFSISIYCIYHYHFHYYDYNYGYILIITYIILYLYFIIILCHMILLHLAVQYFKLGRLKTKRTKALQVNWRHAMLFCYVMLLSFWGFLSQAALSVSLNLDVLLFASVETLEKNLPFVPARILEGYRIVFSRIPLASWFLGSPPTAMIGQFKFVTS